MSAIFNESFLNFDPKIDLTFSSSFKSSFTNERSLCVSRYKTYLQLPTDTTSVYRVKSHSSSTIPLNEEKEHFCAGPSWKMPPRKYLEKKTSREIRQVLLYTFQSKEESKKAFLVDLDDISNSETEKEEKIQMTAKVESKIHEKLLSKLNVISKDSSEVYCEAGNTDQSNPSLANKVDISPQLSNKIPHEPWDEDDSDFDLPKTSGQTQLRKKLIKKQSKIKLQKSNKEHKNFCRQNPFFSAEKLEQRRKFMFAVNQEFKFGVLGDLAREEIDPISRMLEACTSTDQLINPTIRSHLNGSLSLWKNRDNFKQQTIKFTYVGFIWEIPLQLSYNLRSICERLEMSMRSRSSTKRQKTLYAVASRVECWGRIFVFGYMSAPYAFTANQWVRLLSECDVCGEMPMAYAMFDKSKLSGHLKKTVHENQLEFVLPILFNINDRKRNEVEELDDLEKVDGREDKKKQMKKGVLRNKKLKSESSYFSEEEESELSFAESVEHEHKGVGEVISLCHSEEIINESDFCEDN